MSDPQQPKFETNDDPVREIESPGGRVSRPSEDSTIVQSLYQMRVQVVGLGIAFLVMSVAFSAFVIKQNNNYKATLNARNQQIKQTSEALKKWMPTLNELAGYSLNNPELTAIFVRNGLQIGQNQPSGAPVRK